MNPAAARARLAAIHDEVTARVDELAAALPGSLVCREGCADCCVDDLTVFSVEADLIRHHHAVLLAAGTPHAPGACAFLSDAGSCRIYAQRPYVCRTQGLPLRWQDEDETGAPVEMRDICPLNEEPLGMPLLDLAASRCWVLGEFEGRLAGLQAEAEGRFDLRRVSLRGLFGPAAGSEADQPRP